MSKVIFFLEKMWLMVAIVCLFLAGYKSIYVSPEDGLYFLMFTALATVLWLLRRRTRRRMQQEAEANAQNNK